MRARLTVDIPGKPTGQGNPQKITSKFSRYPSHTIDHRNLTVATVADAWERHDPEAGPLGCPVAVTVLAYFARPRSHYGTGRNAGRLRDGAPAVHTQAPDADKIARLILDALTIGGVYQDDRLVCRLVVEKRWSHLDKTRVTVEWGSVHPGKDGGTDDGG